MGKQRSRQLQDGRGFIKDGSVVGDRHTQRKQRGEDMVRNDRDVNREDYNLGWFHPTKAQNEIIRNMLEKECTLVDAPSGCGKSTTVIYQSLKWLKSGDYRKIIFIKSPSTLSLDEVGFLGTNEAKFDFPLMAMRSIFESFMSKEKLEMEEKRGRIEFMFPLWLGGQTFSNALVLVDEMQWFDPSTVKLVLERCDSTCKVVCMFDGKQRYTSRWREDGSKFLVDKVTGIDVSGVRYVKEPLFGYVKLTHNENRRGALSKRITEMFDDLDFDSRKK